MQYLNLQLLAEFSEGRTFQGWQEGAIAFSPTYKYYPNSNQYYGCLQGKKGEKRRAPAWWVQLSLILSLHNPQIRFFLYLTNYYDFIGVIGLFGMVRAWSKINMHDVRLQCLTIDQWGPFSLLRLKKLEILILQQASYCQIRLTRIESQFDLLEDNNISSGKSISQVSPPQQVC